MVCGVWLREQVNVLTYVCDCRQVYKACWYGQLYMYVMHIHMDMWIYLCVIGCKIIVVLHV